MPPKVKAGRYVITPPDRFMEVVSPFNDDHANAFIEGSQDYHKMKTEVSGYMPDEAWYLYLPRAALFTPTAKGWGQMKYNSDSSLATAYTLALRMMLYIATVAHSHSHLCDRVKLTVTVILGEGCTAQNEIKVVNGYLFRLSMRSSKPLDFNFATILNQRLRDNEQIRQQQMSTDFEVGGGDSEEGQPQRTKKRKRVYVKDFEALQHYQMVSFTTWKNLCNTVVPAEHDAVQAFQDDSDIHERSIYNPKIRFCFEIAMTRMMREKPPPAEEFRHIHQWYVRDTEGLKSQCFPDNGRMTYDISIANFHQDNYMYFYFPEIDRATNKSSDQQQQFVAMTIRMPIEQIAPTEEGRLYLTDTGAKMLEMTQSSASNLARQFDQQINTECVTAAQYDIKEWRKNNEKRHLEARKEASDVAGGNTELYNLLYPMYRRQATLANLREGWNNMLNENGPIPDSLKAVVKRYIELKDKRKTMTYEQKHFNANLSPMADFWVKFVSCAEKLFKVHTVHEDLIAILISYAHMCLAEPFNVNMLRHGQSQTSKSFVFKIIATLLLERTFVSISNSTDRAMTGAQGDAELENDLLVRIHDELDPNVIGAEGNTNGQSAMTRQEALYKEITTSGTATFEILVFTETNERKKVLITVPCRQLMLAATNMPIQKIHEAVRSRNNNVHCARNESRQDNGGMMANMARALTTDEEEARIRTIDLWQTMQCHIALLGYMIHAGVFADGLDMTAANHVILQVHSVGKEYGLINCENIRDFERVCNLAKGSVISNAVLLGKDHPLSPIFNLPWHDDYFAWYEKYLVSTKENAAIGLALLSHQHDDPLLNNSIRFCALFVEQSIKENEIKIHTGDIPDPPAQTTLDRSLKVVDKENDDHLFVLHSPVFFREFQKTNTKFPTLDDLIFSLARALRNHKIMTSKPDVQDLAYALKTMTTMSMTVATKMYVTNTRDPNHPDTKHGVKTEPLLYIDNNRVCVPKAIMDKYNTNQRPMFEVLSSILNKRNQNPRDIIYFGASESNPFLFNVIAVNPHPQAPCMRLLREDRVQRIHDEMVDSIVNCGDVNRTLSLINHSEYDDDTHVTLDMDLDDHCIEMYNSKIHLSNKERHTGPSNNPYILQKQLLRAGLINPRDKPYPSNMPQYHAKKFLARLKVNHERIEGGRLASDVLREAINKYRQIPDFTQLMPPPLEDQTGEIHARQPLQGRGTPDVDVVELARDYTERVDEYGCLHFDPIEERLESYNDEPLPSMIHVPVEVEEFNSLSEVYQHFSTAETDSDTDDEEDELQRLYRRTAESQMEEEELAGVFGGMSIAQRRGRDVY